MATCVSLPISSERRLHPLQSRRLTSTVTNILTFTDTYPPNLVLSYSKHIYPFLPFSALLLCHTSCVSSLRKWESEPYIFYKSRPGSTWRPSTVKRTEIRSLITISCDGAVPSHLCWTTDGSNATFLTSCAEMKVIVGHLPVYTSHCWGSRQHLDKIKKTLCDLPPWLRSAPCTIPGFTGYSTSYLAYSWIITY